MIAALALSVTATLGTISVNGTTQNGVNLPGNWDYAEVQLPLPSNPVNGQMQWVGSMDGSGDRIQAGWWYWQAGGKFVPFVQVWKAGTEVVNENLNYYPSGGSILGALSYQGGTWSVWLDAGAWSKVWSQNVGFAPDHWEVTGEVQGMNQPAPEDNFGAGLGSGAFTPFAWWEG